jgi:hypothetical protein
MRAESELNRPREVKISDVFPDLEGKKGADKYFYWDDQLPILQNLYNNLAKDGVFELAENVTQRGLRYVSGRHSKDRKKSAEFIVGRLTAERYEKNKSYAEREEAIMSDLFDELSKVRRSGRNKELSVLHAMYRYAQQEYVLGLKGRISTAERLALSAKKKHSDEMLARRETIYERKVAEDRALQVGPLKAEIDMLQDANAALQKENEQLKAENKSIKQSFKTLKSIIYRLLMITPHTKKFAENLSKNWKLDHVAVTDSLMADLKTLKGGASASLRGQKSTLFSGLKVKEVKVDEEPEKSESRPNKKAT